MSHVWADTRSIERLVRDIVPSPGQESADDLVDRLTGRMAVLVRVARQPFWIWLFFLGAIASFFAMVTCTIQLQMFGAVGFLVLTINCWLVGGLLAKEQSCGLPGVQTRRAVQAQRGDGCEPLIPDVFANFSREQQEFESARRISSLLSKAAHGLGEGMVVPPVREEALL
jgi:hypothetical protein